MSDIRTANPRRRPLHPSIDEELIQKLVHGFYAEVRRDELLGPIFDRAIGGDWDAHLEKLCAFWSSVTMMTGRYKGAPMAAHMRLDGVSEAHFERWLNLWRQTARDLMPDDVAHVFNEAAERIAKSLQLGLFYRPGKPAVSSGATAGKAASG